MAKVETDTRRVVERLKAEGWVNIGGGGHDRFVHAAKPGTMILSPATAICLRA